MFEKKNQIKIEIIKTSKNNIKEFFLPYKWLKPCIQEEHKNMKSYDR